MTEQEYNQQKELQDIFVQALKKGRLQSEEKELHLKEEQYLKKLEKTLS